MYLSRKQILSLLKAKIFTDGVNFKSSHGVIMKILVRVKKERVCQVHYEGALGESAIQISIAGTIAVLFTTPQGIGSNTQVI